MDIQMTLRITNTWNLREKMVKLSHLGRAHNALTLFSNFMPRQKVLDLFELINEDWRRTKLIDDDYNIHYFREHAYKKYRDLPRKFLNLLQMYHNYKDWERKAYNARLDKFIHNYEYDEEYELMTPTFRDALKSSEKSLRDHGHTPEQNINEFLHIVYTTDHGKFLGKEWGIFETGMYKRNDLVLNLKPYLQRYLYCQRQVWKQIYAPDRSALHSVVEGTIGEVVKA